MTHYAHQAAEDAVNISWGLMCPTERETKLRKYAETCTEFVNYVKWNFSDIVEYERSIDYEEDDWPPYTFVNSIGVLLLYKLTDINLFKRTEVFAEIYKEIKALIAAINESVDALNAPSGKHTKAALRTAYDETN